MLGHVASGLEEDFSQPVLPGRGALADAFHALRREQGLSLVDVYVRGREHEELYQLAEAQVRNELTALAKEPEG